MVLRAVARGALTAWAWQNSSQDGTGTVVDGGGVVFCERLLVSGGGWLVALEKMLYFGENVDFLLLVREIVVLLHRF